MDLTGSYTFQASREAVFHALLDQETLKATIPGCEAVWHPPDHAQDMKVRVALPLPLRELQGPYDVTVSILERQEPQRLVLQAGRSGRVGGSVKTVTQVTLSNEGNGTRLTYTTNVAFEGLAVVADNPMFQEIVKYSLSQFLKNLNKHLQTSGMP